MAYAKPTTILFEKVPCTSNDRYKASRGFMESFIDGIEGVEVVSKIVTGSTRAGGSSEIEFTNEEFFFAKAGDTYVTFLSTEDVSSGAVPISYSEKNGSLNDVYMFSVSPIQSSGVPFLHILKCGDINVLSDQQKRFFVAISKETCIIYDGSSVYYKCYYYDPLMLNFYSLDMAGASVVYPRSLSYQIKRLTVLKAHVDAYSDMDLHFYSVDSPQAYSGTYGRFLHIGGFVYFEYNSYDSYTSHIRPCFRVGTLD